MLVLLGHFIQLVNSSRFFFYRLSHVAAHHDRELKARPVLPLCTNFEYKRFSVGEGHVRISDEASVFLKMRYGHDREGDQR
jgi:hypothetical protein